MGRTYIINPSKGQEKTYKLLLELQQAALDVIRPGAKLSAVMTAVQLRLKSKAPHLEPHLTKSCGFATGLEFRESAFQLNAKSEQVFRAGMVFNLALGLENLEDKDATDSRGKKCALFLTLTLALALALTLTLTRYALFLAETVLVKVALASRRTLALTPLPNPTPTSPQPLPILSPTLTPTSPQPLPSPSPSLGPRPRPCPRRR